MKKLSSRLNGGYASTVSAVLLASLFFVGFTGSNGTATPTYGAMMDDKGNDMLLNQGR